jgi:hypothetical protein
MTKVSMDQEKRHPEEPARAGVSKDGWSAIPETEAPPAHDRRRNVRLARKQILRLLTPAIYKA